MDPITMMIIAAIAGGLGTATSMSAQSRENQVAADRENRELEATQARAVRMDDIAAMFQQFGQGETAFSSEMEGLAQMLMQSGQDPDSRNILEAEARRQLERNSGMLDSVLAGRGMYSSGYGVTQQRMLAGETMGSLAAQIAADRRQGQQQRMVGLQGAAGIYGGLSQADLQREMAAIQGWASAYGDPSQGYAGMSPYQPPRPSPFDYFAGFLGGAGGAAAGLYGQDPKAFS